jgi:inorganic pyrophosphatase
MRSKAPLSYFPWRPHPWHGISTGKNPPSLVNAYIEITPFDGIKYEIDKETGYLKVDRPQMSSALPPALYGFIPRTYCGPRVGALSSKAKRGDGDPLDVCVLSERPINRSEVIVPVRVIGGFRMVDRSEADDKIIAVLDNDPYWSGVRELSELSPVLNQRLEHYFSTYKLLPGQKNVVSVEAKYGTKAAWKVTEASREDYRETFPESKDP